jgi:hypothetical protein
MNSNIKKIGLAVLLGLSIVSCDPTSDGDSNPNTGEPKLIAIKSNNTGNACNLWDLQNANPITGISLVPAFSNVRTADFITSPAVLLGQTTMTWQSSAYDNVNKKYAVSIGESIVIYDLTTSAVPAPTTYVLPVATVVVSNRVLAMEYVGGTLYIVQNNEIKKFVGGIVVSFTAPVMIPSSGVGSNTVSNITKNGTNIYFILKGKLYTFSTTSLSITSTVAVSGWSTDIDYNGLEYLAGKIYCAKRTSSTPSLDTLVSVDLAGAETNIPLSTPYFKNWSRISSALDPVNRIYYISSSDGDISNTNTMTEVDLNTGLNTTHPNLSGYQFGLQYKD